LRVERPAVRANGTVRPSERPIVKSAIVRGFVGRLERAEVVVRLLFGFSLMGWFDVVVRLCDRPVSVDERAV
jgi:hypothetical protein